MEKNPDDLEKLVDQFVWINTSGQLVVCFARLGVEAEAGQKKEERVELWGDVEFFVVSYLNLDLHPIEIFFN